MDQDRRHAIDAAIVRIMKSRKVCECVCVVGWLEGGESWEKRGGRGGSVS